MEIIIKRIKELLSKGGLSENGIKVLEFMLEKKRLPKFSIKEEKKLYEWCGRMRKRLPMLKTSYREFNSILLDMGWNSFEKRRKRRANEFFEFVEQHGRLPKPSVKKEKSLYSWCSVVVKNKGVSELYPEVYAKLKEMRWGEKRNFRTEKRAEEFWKFIEENGRLPKYTKREERPLYEWCRHVRYRVNNLDEKCPGVYEKIQSLTVKKQARSVYGNDPDKKYILSMDYIAKNNRIPSSRAQSVEERALGSFCIRVMRNDNNLAERFPKLRDSILMFRNDVQKKV